MKREDILPIIFGDIYMELAPGETHTIFCSNANKDANEAAPFFFTSAWNLGASFGNYSIF